MFDKKKMRPPIKKHTPAPLKETKLIVPTLEPVAKRPERRCVFTIAVGPTMQWMFDITLPTIKAYCERHGLDFIVVDDTYRQDEHPCYMKQFINTLWWRYDRVLYLDADIMVSPYAPNLFEVVPDGYCGAYNEGPLYDFVHKDSVHTNRRIVMEGYMSLYNKEMEKYGEPLIDIRNWNNKYYNAGMFLCSKYTNPHVPPVHGVMRMPNSGHFDQNYFNTMIIKHMIPMFDLNVCWNKMITVSGDMLENTYFAHYASAEAKKRLKEDAKRVWPEPRKIRNYTLNIVMDYKADGWILEWMVDAICDQKPDHVTINISKEPLNQHNVINYYFPYREYEQKSEYAKDVVFCTHPEVTDVWNKSVEEADHVIVMCKKYQDSVLASRDTVTLIYPGVDEQYRDDRLRLLNPVDMVHRGYRKGEDLWEELCTVPWLKCTCTDGKYTKEELLDLYLQSEVVICTSTMEGGPMLVLEGLALGKMVVAPDVGFVNEMPGVRVYKDKEKLYKILQEYYSKKLEYAKRIIDNYTWKQWGQKHYEVFNNLMENI